MNSENNNSHVIIAGALLILVILAALFLPMRVRASGITVCNGIDYSSVYDFDYYINRYPDIAAVYGNDPEGALMHFVLFGMAEGRQGREEAVNPIQGPLTGMTVILDAGHGGRDPGCIRNGVYEKDINLSIVLKTKALLEAYGATVLLTRYDDSYVSLEYRYTFENLHPEAVMVCIHCNALANNTRFSGMTAYCNAALNPLNLGFASCVYSGAREATGAIDRGVRTAAMAKVIRYSTIPSVLIETGYLSSSAEFPLLTSDSYQDLIAAGITNGILTYHAAVTGASF